MLHIYFIVLRK